MITLSFDFSIGADLFPVAEKHQQALIDTLAHQQLSLWQAIPFFVLPAYTKAWMEQGCLCIANGRNPIYPLVVQCRHLLSARS
ncbi:MAG: hypothetical protein AAF734_10700 [Bacteroidota bacterium]